MIDYLSLFKRLDNFKQRTGYQITARCPFPDHNDKHSSFSGEYKNGTWNCKGCGAKGNAYKLAVELNLLEPHQYIPKDDNYMNGTSRTQHDPKKTKEFLDYISPPKKEEEKVKELTAEEIARHEEYKQNLKDKYKDWESRTFFAKSMIDELDIGIDSNNNFWFGQHDINGKLIAIQKHKGFHLGDGRCKWYLKHKIDDYRKDKDLFIAEGVKDAITLNFFGKQVVSSTAGCLSIPKDKDGNYDLELFKDFCQKNIKNEMACIYVVYDHLDGYEGANNLAHEIKSKYPHLKIIVAEWDDDKPKGYDVTDSFHDDILESFFGACMNGEEYEIIDNNTEQEPADPCNGSQSFNGREYMKKEFTPVDYLVRNLVDEKGVAIIGGDTGSGKSWVGLQLALSISTGTKAFDFFEVKQSKVLLVQFENSDFNQQKRLRKQIPQFNNKWETELYICPLKPKNKVFIDNWEIIRQTLIKEDFRDGVLIVDNMYTSTALNIQENNELKRLLGQIHDIKQEFNLTIICIAHTNKTNDGGKQKAIHRDDLQGGKTLVNFADNVTMMHESSLGGGLRFAKIEKAGRVDENALYRIPFKMHWDSDTGLFTKGVIIRNEAIHFLPPTERFEDRIIKDIVLGTPIEHLPYFTREQFIENIPNDDKDDYKHPTQITRLINLFVSWGYIKRIGHNKYVADLKTIDDLVISPKG